jgi:ATP/maltotriose-dependent transcriptional regulator MalT
MPAMLSPPTKLAVPRTAEHVPRPALLLALDRALAHAAVVRIVGLPGAGKSSTAAQWVRAAQARGERCGWWRLDEDDVDVAALLDALRHHPQHGAPGRMPAWSPDNQPDPRRFARRFFAELAGADGAPLTLVFDDCHRLPDEAVLFEMLDAARELGPQRLRLLLLSRHPPPPLLARGRLAGWLQVIDKLALSDDEAAAVAERVSGRRWSRAEAESLRAAQGWMAHVLALAQAPPATTGADAGAPSARASGEVGDFLCHELLLMLPAADRRDFRLLAELPELPRSLGAVTPAMARLLDQLAARRYFVDIVAADGARPAWRLHDLLRDGLRARNAAAEPAPALATARRGFAAAVLPQSPDTAMNLLVAAADTEGALALLRRHGRAWLAQGRHGQLLGWLSALPAADDAEALLWRAEAQLPGAPEEARPLFARARAQWLARARAAAAGQVDGAAADGAYRAWCGEVASYVVQWGAVQGLAALVDELEALEQQLGPAPGDLRFRTAADALTALMYGRAEDPRIRHYAQATALAVAQAPDANSRIAAAAQLLIYRLWWAGDFPGGRALYDSFDAEVDMPAAHAGSQALSPLAQLLWWSNSAIVDWQCGDPARCYAKVDRGLALAEASGVHVRDFFLLTQGIFCALSQEDWPRAEGWLARLAQTERSHRRLDTMVHHFFRSWYALSRGDAATALAHARAALPMAEAMGSLFHKVIVLSALAPAALHAGERAAAEQAYRSQLALAKGSQNPTFAYIAFCAGAEIALVSGDEAALAKQVERMLTVKHLGGFHSDCGWRTPVRARLLAFALERGLLPAVARQWIDEKRIAPPSGASLAALRAWPMPVQIQALDGLSVKVNGRASDGGAKPASRLRELLAVLVARRQGATQAELCDWLWPDAEGDRAAASLKTGVHRLRGWLGHDAVQVRNGIVALNLLRVACDLWWHEDHEPRALAAAASQVLAGCNAPPVAQLRERLAGPALPRA